MLSTFRRWVVAATTLATLTPLLSLHETAGASSSVPASISTIVSAGDTYINEIRNAFFCSTKTCLAERTQNFKLAKDGQAPRCRDSRRIEGDASLRLPGTGAVTSR